MKFKKEHTESEWFALVEQAEKTMSLPIWFRIVFKLRRILEPELIERLGWKYLKTGDYHWRDYHSPKYNMYRDHVNHVIHSFCDKSGRLLDVGCGEGLILSLFNEQEDLIPYGIDCSELAIAFAHERGVKNCKCVDLFDYDGSDYDFVFAGDILEHLDHPDLALKKMKGFLKPRGFLYVSTPIQGGKPHSGDKYALTVDGVLEILGKELNVIHHETQPTWLKNYFIARNEEQKEEGGGLIHEEYRIDVGQE